MFDGECKYCLVRAKGLMLTSVFTVCGLKHRNIKCNVCLSLFAIHCGWNSVDAG
jgi:hypothetical protein